MNLLDSQKKQKKVESVFNEMDCASPVIYLLSAGADPTDSIEGLARKKKTDVACVSMGEVCAMRYAPPPLSLAPPSLPPSLSLLPAFTHR